MKRFIYTILLICAPGLALFPRECSAQDQSAFVAAVLREAGQDLDRLNKIIEDHERLIREYPTAEFVPTVLLQLAELHERRSTLLYQKAMTIYEKELEAFDAKQRSDEPIMPRISLAQTIEYCYRLLKEYPDAKGKDRVYYRLAMAHLQEGNTQLAQQFFQNIIDEFPQSIINLEAHFRVGEYYFDRREYATAIEHYRLLLGHWDNPYFDMALYKLGWSCYNLNDYANSITTFVYLLEDIDMVEKTDSKFIGKTKADLKSESIQYIASCYSEFGGPEGAQTFFQSRTEKYYTLPVLTSLAELYQKRNYYDEAIAALTVILDLYPYHENAPALYKRIIENNDLDGKTEQANTIREKVVQEFGPGGRWIAKFPEGEKYRTATTMAQETLLYLGAYYQAQAQKKSTNRDYQLAIRKYQEFLEKFPTAADAGRIQYYIAECYYAQSLFKEAAAAYQRVVTQYDSSSYREEAAYNRVLCSYQNMGVEPAKDSTAVYIDEFIGSDDVLIVNVTRPSEGEVLRACNDFSRLFPASKWFDAVMMKFGEVLSELKAYPWAVRVYKKVVESGTAGAYHLTAAMNAGQCYFDAGQYEQADAWFSALAKNYPDSVQFSERALKLAGAAKFKMAEGLGQQNKLEESAQLLHVVALESKDVQMRSRALFEAALQYQKAKRDTLAAQTFEELANSIPNSELADQSLYRAANLREKHNDWPLAAANYLMLADRYPKSPMAVRSLKSAALCYELLQDWNRAKNTYDRFVTQYPDTVTEVLECAFKAGEMAHKAEQWESAGQAFRKTVDLYRSFTAGGREADAYYAAQAQFMLGELLFDDYKKISLSTSREVTLKRKKFQDVFKAYRDALEFQVADWSTASSYRIGMALEEFVRALRESPIPSGLSGDDLLAYQTKLNEAARPYQERALETYVKTVDQAHTNNIDNTWINLCRERMHALMQELGYRPGQPIQENKEISNGTGE
jgi:cellulose synthase operon protein C